MSNKEHAPQPQSQKEGFIFTDREKLYSRVSTLRFRNIINDYQTIVHNIEVSSNSFGTFLFVTASYPKNDKREYLTFWGAGFHDHRERWLTNEWQWYLTNARFQQDNVPLTKMQANKLIDERYQEIAPYIQEDTQTKRGQLFEMLAEILDEDGALVELEDLGGILGIEFLLGEDDEELDHPD